jgi:hypothetical protein
MNRVLKAIAQRKEIIAGRLASGQVTQEQIDKTHKLLDLELDEYVKFQELKSLASTDGTMTLEEATTVYNYLGTIPETFNQQPVEVKAVLTQIYKELLEKAIIARRRAG